MAALQKKKIRKRPWTRIWGLPLHHIVGSFPSGLAKTQFQATRCELDSVWARDNDKGIWVFDSEKHTLGKKYECCCWHNSVIPGIHPITLVPRQACMKIVHYASSKPRYPTQPQTSSSSAWSHRCMGRGYSRYIPGFADFHLFIWLNRYMRMSLRVCCHV